MLKLKINLCTKNSKKLYINTLILLLRLINVLICFIVKQKMFQTETSFVFLGTGRPDRLTQTCQVETTKPGKYQPDRFGL